MALNEPASTGAAGKDERAEAPSKNEKAEPKKAARDEAPAASATSAAAASAAADSAGAKSTSAASGASGGADGAAPAERARDRLGPWLVPAYFAGLVLVFCGERVLSSFDALRYALTGLGLAVAVASTALRFVAASGPAAEGDERRVADRTLALFAALGLLAIGIYFTTTDTGKELLGIAKAAPATRARFEGAVTVAWVALLVVSVVPLAFGERAFAPMRRAERIEARRVRAAIASGLTLALAATYTALATYAVGELEVKVDFSYFRTARPSDSTRNVAASLSEPVKVLAFFPRLNDVGTEVEGYLRDLASSAPKLEVEIHDRLLVPAIAKEAKVTTDGVVVLLRGGSRETLTIGADMKTAATKLKSLDGDFQKALLKSMRAQRTAYLTVGHGELNETSSGPAASEGRTAKGLRKILESQNYLVKDLGLAQGLGNEIPADAYLVAMVGPSQAPLPEEVAAIRRFAERGGKLLLALDPDAKADLAPLAEALELTWQPAVLANDKTYIRRRFNPSDRTILVTNRFSSHASVSTLSRNSARAPVVFPGAAALDKKPNAAAKIDFTVRSLGETFGDVDGDFEFDKDEEKRSVYNLAAAVTRTPEGAEGGDDKGAKGPNELRAFVLGDADALSDAALANEPNILLLVDALRWLGGEESWSGAIATTEDVRIEHTKEKDAIWFYATIFGAPAIVLGLGLAFVRRTRRPRGRSA